MVINNAALDELTNKAKTSQRLRSSFDLRTSAEDQSQRILNAVEPGTNVPIHRHPYTTETVIVIRGSLDEIFFDDNGNATQTYHLSCDGDIKLMNIPAGQWHSIGNIEPGTIIFEGKDGEYRPLSSDDTLITN